MLQKLLGVCFFATILILSYVATLHIVTNRVDALHHEHRIAAVASATERTRTLRLSGPVSLRPISDHVPVGEKKYVVKKVKEPKTIKASKKKSKSDRQLASNKFKKNKQKKKNRSTNSHR